MSVNDTASVSGFRDAKDYRAAIAAIDDSTRAFEVQIEAARKLKPSESDTTESTPLLPQSRLVDQHQQQSRLVDTLQGDIQDDLHTSSDATQKIVASSLIAIDDTLLRHDHNFDSLERHRSPETAATATQSSVERAQKLILALSHTQSEIIRTRLDRTYLQALEATNLDNNGYEKDIGSSTHKKVELVKADLKSLHAEIDDVSELLVSREHGDVLITINSSLGEAQRSLQQEEAREAVEQIGSMREQLEVMTERIEILQSHRVLLQRLADHLKHINPKSSAGQPLAAAQTHSEDLRQDTASLAALQQYLGLANSSSVHTAKSEQIDSAFDIFTSHVSSSLAIQKEQEGIIRNHSPIADMANHDSHVVEKSAHSSDLDNLDNEIANTKARMDALPL